MSEPMTSVEIEDVLSSIRRLVSEDLRPAARPAPPPPPEDAGDKLILTPALRVVPPTEAGPVAAAPAAAEAVDARPSGQIETVVAVVGAAVQDSEWEPETGDTSAFGHQTWAPLDFGTVAEAEVLTPAPVDSDWATDDGTEAWAAEPVAEPVVVPLTLVHPLRDAEHRIADRAETETMAEIKAALSPAEDGLEEQVLRELVRDIIREELQGTLGERITRNIRKLVRSEINRVIASRAFD